MTGQIVDLSRNESQGSGAVDAPPEARPRKSRIEGCLGMLRIDSPANEEQAEFSDCKRPHATHRKRPFCSSNSIHRRGAERTVIVGTTNAMSVS